MTAIASFADVRVDSGRKAGTFALTVLVHVALVLALAATEAPPRLLDVSLASFEVVDLSPNETEPVEAPPPTPDPAPAPKRETVPEPPPLPPEEEAVSEPVPEPVPASEPEPEPEPLAKAPPEPAPVVPRIAPPPRKPTPPRDRAVKPEPKAEPVRQMTERTATSATEKPSAPAEPAYTPPSATAAYLSNPKPPYPALARRRGMQGRVVLRVLVGPGGRAREVMVRRGSGHTLLDRAALKAVRNWVFVPAQRGGRAVQAELDVPIRFSLKD